MLLHLSSSGLPANSGLKCDQFNWGIGAGWIGGTDGTIDCAGSCTGGTGSTTGGAIGGGWGAGAPPSAMFDYTVGCVINDLILYLTLTWLFWNKFMSEQNYDLTVNEQWWR